MHYMIFYLGIYKNCSMHNRIQHAQQETDLNDSRHYKAGRLGLRYRNLWTWSVCTQEAFCCTARMLSTIRVDPRLQVPSSGNGVLTLC